MPRHNKKRNTAFLYECLVREIVKKTISKQNDKRDVAVNLLKEFFKRGTELNKELHLYKILLETRGLSPRLSDKLIQESKESYKKLDKQKIFNEQSALIKKINKNISANVFSNFVPNYKNLATLSQIFGEDLTVKRRIMLEENILNHLAERHEKDTKESKKMSGLIVGKFIKKFNDSYDDNLLECQKKCINKYILSFMDSGVDFKVYLNEEIFRLKEKVNSAFLLEEIKEDSSMMEKMKEVKKILEQFNAKPFDKQSLLKVLKIQNLVEEIENE